ncbi:hypothetical protein FRB90_011653 [Tulasnella sp. 427]|nr:hypothetical protein FRB90_011653 [Tulasnella sp. 427]
MSAASRKASVTANVAAGRNSRTVSSDRLLLATSCKQGSTWATPQDFVFQLALKIPAKLHYFVRIYPFSPDRNRQRYLLCCAHASDPLAKQHIGKDYDIATALLNRFEKSGWRAAKILYVQKGPQLEEALERVKSDTTPFDGFKVKLGDVKKEIARQKKAKDDASNDAFDEQEFKASLKRKRDVSVEEVLHLARAARDATKKYDIGGQDRKELARYLAEAPTGVRWEPLLRTFVDQRPGASRHSYATWKRMLVEEKEWFESEVEFLRRPMIKRRRLISKTLGK